MNSLLMNQVWLCEYNGTKICVKYLRLEEEWMKEMAILMDVGERGGNG